MEPVLPTSIISNEHSLIMRMFSLLRKEFNRLKENSMFDAVFIDIAVDFFETYVDRNHHGKEEEVLFKALQGKDISDAHRQIIDRLKNDHDYEMKHVGTLIMAKKKYITGETNSLSDLLIIMETLIGYYPTHVETEEKFFPVFVKKYLNEEEQEKLKNNFLKFDQTMIHERFLSIVTELEKTM